MVIKDELLTTGEAANFLKTTPGNLYNYVGARRVPYRRIGRKILFSRVELEKFLSSCPGVNIDEAIKNIR